MRRSDRRGPWRQSGRLGALAGVSFSVKVFGWLTYPGSRTMIARRNAFAIRLGGVRRRQDSEWSADHVAVHDVTLKEVQEPSWNVRTGWLPGRNNTIWIYGRTYAGRYLFVVAVADDGEAFVVTAREMTPNEKKTFQRKAR